MTVEQIKQRQEQVNNNLIKLLGQQETLIQHLLGAQPVPECQDIPSENTGGLMEEISMSQSVTEILVTKLTYGFKELEEVVYAPSVVKE